MPTETPRILLRSAITRRPRSTCGSLPPEHFMEATPQATQRKITLESLDLVHARRPDVQVFNELLVQYPLPRRKKPGQVVPDNMVVIHAGADQSRGQLRRALATGPSVLGAGVRVQEQQTQGLRRQHGQVRARAESAVLPAVLPRRQEMTLYQHTGKRYVIGAAQRAGPLPFPNWSWSWPCWTAGSASGFAANCCRCRENYCPEWTILAGGSAKCSVSAMRPRRKCAPACRAGGLAPSDSGGQVSSWYTCCTRQTAAHATDSSSASASARPRPARPARRARRVGRAGRSPSTWRTIYPFPRPKSAAGSPGCRVGRPDTCEGGSENSRPRAGPIQPAVGRIRRRLLFGRYLSDNACRH